MSRKEAIKVLESMRASAANKTEADMKTVCEGFDFEVWEGSNHTTYQHRKYHQLMGQWPRHGEVLPVYVRKLVARIKQLQALEGEEHGRAEITK